MSSVGANPSDNGQGTAAYSPWRELLPLPESWRSLPAAFVNSARAHSSRTAVSDSTGASLTYGAAFLRALAHRPRHGPHLGRCKPRRPDGPARRPGGRRQPGRLALGQDPGQPELHCQPGGRRFVDRSVRDHARRDVGKGPRQVQDRAQGDADPAGGHPEAGHPGRQALGRRRRAGSCRSARSGPSCRASAANASTPRRRSSSPRARPATPRAWSSRTAMS